MNLLYTECVGGSPSDGLPKLLGVNKDAVDQIRTALLTGDYPGLLAALRAHATVTVSGDGCWLWRDLNNSSYPKAVPLPGGTASGLHRQVLEAKLGVPLGKRHVLHSCAVSACVNPDHLQAGHLREPAEPISRIAELEAALREARPGHPLLEKVRPRQESNLRPRD